MSERTMYQPYCSPALVTTMRVGPSLTIVEEEEEDPEPPNASTNPVDAGRHSGRIGTCGGVIGDGGSKGGGGEDGGGGGNGGGGGGGIGGGRRRLKRRRQWWWLRRRR